MARNAAPKKASGKAKPQSSAAPPEDVSSASSSEGEEGAPAAAESAEEEDESSSASSSGEEQGDEDDKDEEEEEKDSGNPNIDLIKVKGKLHAAHKQCTAAAKRARTFEVQRQIKRLKSLASSDEAAKTAAEAELAALKVLDASSMAARALRSKLVKAKLLPRPAQLEAGAEALDDEEWPLLSLVEKHPQLKDATPIVGGAPASAEQRAQAKLTSNKVLAEQVASATEALRALLKPDQAYARKLAAKADSKPVEAEAGPVKPVSGFKPLGEKELLARDWSGSEDESEEDDGEEEEGEDEDVEMDEGEEGSIDEDEAQERLQALGDLSRYEGLVVGSSDESAGSDEEADEDEALPLPSKGATGTDKGKAKEVKPSQRTSAKRKRSDSVGSASSSSSVEEPAPKLKAKAKKPAKRAAIASRSPSPIVPGTSTFLPSLSSGFVGGRGLALGRGSDDDWSGDEAQLSDIDSDAEDRGADGKKDKRKNRRGQQARRAIWEKKYGKKANHIKLLAKEPKKTALPRRGAEAAAQRGGRQRPAPFQAPVAGDGGWKGGASAKVSSSTAPSAAPAVAKPAQAQPQVPRPMASFSRPPANYSNARAPPSRAPQRAQPSKAPSAAEMHPSWIAKQKQKELAAAALSGAGKPKKIVFD